MNRIHRRTVIIVLGILLLLFIVIGPAAPLWARLSAQ